MSIDDITFENTEFEVIANYPKSNKKVRVKVLQTFGEWEGCTGRKYIGDWFTNNEMYSSKAACEVGEKFTLYDQGIDGSLNAKGEFKPVRSYRVEGDEHVDTMSWKGVFEFMGADYEWEGRCVWEISTLISSWQSYIDNAWPYEAGGPERDENGKPRGVSRMKEAAKESLEKCGATLLRQQ